MNSRINAVATTIIILAASLTAYADDYIIMRNGDEIKCRIIQSDREMLTMDIKERNGRQYKSESENCIKLTDIYMLRYEKRGNVYITPEGKRITGESQKIPKGADIIYLVSGKEIPAYHLSFEENTISYQATKEKKKARSNRVTLPNSDVFIIKYSDGSRDLVTDITQKPQPLPDPEPELAPDPAPETIAQAEPEIRVITHTVKRGETLTAIAERYNVTPADIIRWNRMPAKTRPNARIAAGKKLEIHVTIIR